MLNAATWFLWQVYKLVVAFALRIDRVWCLITPTRKISLHSSQIHSTTSNQIIKSQVISSSLYVDMESERFPILRVHHFTYTMAKLGH
jgi:hypothetical protein